MAKALKTNGNLIKPDNIMEGGRDVSLSALVLFYRSPQKLTKRKALGIVKIHYITGNIKKGTQ